MENEMETRITLGALPRPQKVCKMIALNSQITDINVTILHTFGVGSRYRATLNPKFYALTHNLAPKA